jgi:CheY-like chemotaxis protein
MESPAKILVVDDEAAGRFGKVQTLKRAGYVVVEAATGREARAGQQKSGPISLSST